MTTFAAPDKFTLIPCSDGTVDATIYKLKKKTFA